MGQGRAQQEKAHQDRKNTILNTIKSMEKLTLKDGKFYRGTTEVKPEFGNREQIALIRQMEVRLEQGYTLGDLWDYEEVIYVPMLRFDCPFCNKENKIKLDESSEFPTQLSEFSHDVLDILCDYCNEHFELQYDEEVSKNKLTLRFNQNTEENI